jgi:hypothetical protein
MLTFNSYLAKRRQREEGCVSSAQLPALQSFINVIKLFIIDALAK